MGQGVHNIRSDVGRCLLKEYKISAVRLEAGPPLQWAIAFEIQAHFPGQISVEDVRQGSDDNCGHAAPVEVRVHH